jgi:hypothetical protein
MFATESLISDVVSGFFILFENIYLVGDMVEAAGAKGVVESIEFRTTKIRDADGRVRIIRNGDMKPVINYAKDYTMVGRHDGSRLRCRPAVSVRESAAGRHRLRAESADMLGDTRIDGITVFGASTDRADIDARPARTPRASRGRATPPYQRDTEPSRAPRIQPSRSGEHARRIRRRARVKTSRKTTGPLVAFPVPFSIQPVAGRFVS